MTSTVTAPAPAAPARPAAPGSSAGLGSLIASEWIKLRSVRSTYAYLVSCLAAIAGGSAIAMLMVADYDASPPAEQAAFGSADPANLSVPIAMFCLSALGAFAMTTEYATGMIRTSLTAVPTRGRLLTAKATVVGATALLAGQAVTFLSYFAGVLIVGDRQGAIRPWESFGDALPSLLSDGIVIGVAGLVGLGLGAALRSSAAALVSLTGLLFIAPIVTLFLPESWQDEFDAVLLSSLGRQLAGLDPEAVLSPAQAAVTLGVYLVVALGAGAVLLKRRDA